MSESVATTEVTACPMCDADTASTIVETPDLMYPGDEQFRMVRCEHCGHLYQNPRPRLDAIDRYYPPGYLLFLEAIEDEPNPIRRLDRANGLRKRCQVVDRAIAQPGRLLDIGCATGIFLDGMRQRGWQVQGIEPVAHAADYARQRFGLDVFCGTLLDAGLPTAGFDAITMWDVLEHIHDPRPALAELSRLLRPGGILMLSLPNPDSLEARLFGAAWQGWDLPRHMNLFRPLQFKSYLADYGMPVEWIRSFSAGHAVMSLSVARKLHTAGRNSDLMLRLLNSFPIRMLTLPYYAGPASWFNLSSIMIVLARRNTQAVPAPTTL